MGLGSKVRERTLAHLINLYQLFIIASLVVFSTYGIFHNSLHTNNQLALMISVFPIIGLMASIGYYSITPAPKHCLRSYMFYATNLIIGITTILLQLLWGAVIPFLPYLSTIVSLNLVLSYRLKTLKFYMMIYSLLLILQLFNILPIIKLPVWYDLKLTTKLINTILTIIVNLLLFFISKITPLTGLWYIITPRTNELIQDIFLDGAKYRLIQHRLRNMVQIITTTKQSKLISEILTNIFNISPETKLRHFKRHLELLKQLYLPKNFSISQDQEELSVLIKEVPPIAVVILLELIHNALKHAKSIVQLSVDFQHPSYVDFRIINDKNASTHLQNLKEYSIFSEVPLLLETMQLGKLQVAVKPTKTEVILRLKRNAKEA